MTLEATDREEGENSAAFGESVVASYSGKLCKDQSKMDVMAVNCGACYVRSHIRACVVGLVHQIVKLKACAIHAICSFQIPSLQVLMIVCSSKSTAEGFFSFLVFV